MAFPTYKESPAAPFVDRINATIVREETIQAGYLGQVKAKVVESPGYVNASS